MRKEFNIPKSGGVQMQDNRLLSDGSNENDLRAVNITTMHTFLGPETEVIHSFEDLFNLTVSKIDLMLQDKFKKEEEEIKRLDAKKRNEEVDHIVASLVETFNALPIDAQARVRSRIGIRYSEVPITNKPIENNVTKGNTTKKVKKGSNKPATEGSGSGSEASESHS